MPPLTRNQVIIVGIIGLIVLIFILIFLGVIPGLQTSTNKPPEVKLTVFGVDDPRNFSNLIDNYEKARPNVKVNYTQIPETSYEDSLISALAASHGPDVFMFKNSWLPKHIDKITPAASIQISQTQVEQLFPRVIEEDFINKGAVYALPLYIDTLAFLYNRDVFDAKAIPLPPRTWPEFENLIPKLLEINTTSQIVKPAAAIGGSGQSISHASDLLNLLFMQYQNPKISDQGQIRFNSDALSAFNFYLQFANPGSQYYTWNDNLPNSIDSFSQGDTAIIFNYLSQIPTIKSKNPFLSLGIAHMLQFGGSYQPVNIANYWGLAVSKQSLNPSWAWDFIVTVTTNPQISDSYLQTRRQSPALLTLINKYLDDSRLGVFARAALTARSWPEPDSDALEGIFSNMISSVLNGRLAPKDALYKAENQINSSR